MFSESLFRDYHCQGPCVGSSLLIKSEISSCTLYREETWPVPGLPENQVRVSEGLS